MIWLSRVKALGSFWQHACKALGTGAFLNGFGSFFAECMLASRHRGVSLKVASRPCMSSSAHGSESKQCRHLVCEVGCALCQHDF
jgi:hypothetical protein